MNDFVFTKFGFAYLLWYAYARLLSYVLLGEAMPAVKVFHSFALHLVSLVPDMSSGIQIVETYLRFVIYLATMAGLVMLFGMICLRTVSTFSRESADNRFYFSPSMRERARKRRERSEQTAAILARMQECDPPHEGA